MKDGSRVVLAGEAEGLGACVRISSLSLFLLSPCDADLFNETPKKTRERMHARMQITTPLLLL